VTRLLLAALIAFCAGSVISADYLRVQRPVTLKDGPAGSAPILDRLGEGALLELLSDAQQNGYYYARDPISGFEGWVYRTFVRRLPGALPGPEPGAASAPPGGGGGDDEGESVWARFDSDFIQKHFSNDLAFSSVTFDEQWRAGPRHAMSATKISCSGTDGEIHVGAYERYIAFGATEKPFSRLSNQSTIAWGLVAEPPNATNDEWNTLKALEGTRITFTGYMRVWNEGHFDDEKAQKPDGSSNPNHLVEVHPAWHMESTDEGSEDYDFPPTAPMDRYAGYGMTKASSIFAAQSTGTWPRAYVSNGQLYVFLSKESNFYQLPVRILSIQATSDGLILTADVCRFVGCADNQYAHRNLRLVTRTDSQGGQPFTEGEMTELLGVFSVHLGRAKQLAAPAASAAEAMFVGSALEFYVFSRATNKAVKSSKCVPE